MRSLLVVVLAGIAMSAADDPWTKVKEVKSGTEVRVFKRNTPQAMVAKMDELTSDNLVVVVKNEQVAIPRDQIDRIDARPSQTKNRVTSKTESKTTDPDTTPAPPGYHSRTPSTSTSSGLSVGSKPDFETIYRRSAATPTQK